MRRKAAVVNMSSCVACGECLYVCRRNAVLVKAGCYANIDIDRCVGCGICAKNCPVGCISLAEREEEKNA